MSRGAQGAELGRLLRHLVDEGFIDHDAALDGRVGVTDLSCSNPVGLVHVDGHPTLVVKGGTVSVDGIDPIEAETAAYCWLSASAATARLAPAPILDAARGLAIVTRPLMDAVSLHEALESAPAERETLIAALGRVLGVVHSARAGLQDLAARRPWILGVPAGRIPVIAVGNAAARRLVEDIAQCAPVAAAIVRFDRSWTARTGIHGDIKFDNVLVAPDRMLLIDWELAGVGEPVWDLAGLVDGLLLPWCVAGGGPAVDRALVADLAEPALAAHRAVAGDGLSPAPEDLATAVVARLAQTATQLAAMGHDRPEAAEAAPRLLAAATELAADLAGDRELTTECAP